MRVIGIQHTIVIDKHIMSLFHKVDRDIKREGGNEGVREKNRERGGGMEIKGSNGREGLAFTRFYVHVCCVQREVIVGGLDTLCTVFM